MDKTVQTKVGLNEFEFLTVVGRGSFGKVMLVSFKSNQKLYAMKVLRKEAV
jgi:serine/threonine protein kinase